MTMIIDKNDSTYKNFVDAKKIYGMYTEEQSVDLLKFITQQSDSGKIRFGNGMTPKDFCSIEGIEHQVEVGEQEGIVSVYYVVHDLSNNHKWIESKLKVKHVEDD